MKAAVYWKVIISVLILAVSCQNINRYQRQKIVIKEGGYEDILIAISERTPEDWQIVENLKIYWTNASKALYRATNNHTFFRKISILVPQSWTSRQSLPARKEAYQYANVIVDNSNAAQGNTPYVQRTLENCLTEGEFIHFSPDYILHGFISRYGRPERVIVHEWGHLRWGLGDEYPRPGTDDPSFYFGKQLFPGAVRPAVPVRCSVEVRGMLKTVRKGHQPIPGCENDQTGLPNDDCFFYLSDSQSATGSVMFAQYLDSVITFCDNNTNDNASLHNAEAPNMQNRLCGGRSAWEVMREHTDFTDFTGLKNLTGSALEPEFTIVQRTSSNRVVLVLDKSGSMGRDKPTRIEKLRSDANQFLMNVISDGTQVGLIQFDSSASILSHLKRIESEADRMGLVDLLPTIASGGTCIGCGILKAIEVLNTAGNPAGGNIILISDGQDGDGAKFTEGVIAVKEADVVVDSILYTANADQRLVALARETNGMAFFERSSNHVVSTNLIQALIETVAQRQVSGNATIPQLVLLDSIAVANMQTIFLTFHLDPSIGDRTLVSLTYASNLFNSSEISINITSPNGTLLSSLDPNITETDESIRTIRLRIPGLAESGKWIISVRNDNLGLLNSRILVLSRAVDTTVEPLTVKVITSNDHVDFTDRSTVLLKIVARVSMGYAPVLNANVMAYVTSESMGITRVNLRDQGTGADDTKNDGVYAGYFLNYTQNGHYSIEVQVSNDDGYATVVTEGASGAYQKLDPNDTSTLPNKIQTEAVPPFERSTSGGFITVENKVDGDLFPPSAIKDLRLAGLFYENKTMILQWTAVGDDMDQGGPAALYDVRFCNTSKQCRYDFETCTQIEPDDVIHGNTSDPAEPYTTETLTIRLPETLANTTLYWGMKVQDDSGQWSDLSNVLPAGVYYIPPQLMNTPDTSSSRMPTTDIPTTANTTATTSTRTGSSSTSRHTTTTPKTTTTTRYQTISTGPKRDRLIIWVTICSLGCVILIALLTMLACCARVIKTRSTHKAISKRLHSQSAPDNGSSYSSGKSFDSVPTKLGQNEYYNHILPLDIETGRSLNDSQQYSPGVHVVSRPLFYVPRYFAGPPGIRGYHLRRQSFK